MGSSEQPLSLDHIRFCQRATLAAAIPSSGGVSNLLGTRPARTLSTLHMLFTEGDAPRYFVQMLKKNSEVLL